MFWRLKGLKHVTPGERQAGRPRRSDGCGHGVTFACAVGRSEKLVHSFKGFKGLKGFKGFKGFKGLKGFKRLRAGLDAHKKPLMWPWGACWLRDEARQENV